jgi:carboxylesterase type B
MLLALIYLLSLRLAVAKPVSPRQAGSTAAPSVPTGSVVPTATIYPSSASSQPVKVVGVNRPTVGYHSYLSIPFAQPPVGDLGFAPPQPANYTNTTVIAQQWSPACPQLKDAAQGFGDVSGSYEIQEDCLYINVFTPEGTTDNASLPVMFWV